ncbi:MAG: MBL fold metallo-hydrolase [Clostridia bacterium]
MKIKYFGTAAAEAWPGMYCHCESCKRAWELRGKNLRTRSQALVDDGLLIDFPPDTYLHMLQDGLDLPNIHHILITHTHEDHLYTDDLRWRGGYYCSGEEGYLNLYGNDALMRRMDAIEKEDTTTLRWHEWQAFETYPVMDYAVTPMLARHNPKEKCFIYHIEKDGKSLLYGNDTGIFPDATWAYLQGKRFDVVSLDCTMLIIPEGTNHMGIEDVVTVRDRMLREGMADKNTAFVITHFSHNGKLLHHEIEAAVAPYGIHVAYDGYELFF